MSLPVTVLYGTLNVLLTAALALNVSRLRIRHQAFVGQIPEPLLRPVRAHGNNAEWLPVTVFLVAFLELQHAPSLPLHLLAGGLLAARVIRDSFMLARINGRPAVIANYLMVFGMGFWSLWLRLGR